MRLEQFAGLAIEAAHDGVHVAELALQKSNVGIVAHGSTSSSAKRGYGLLGMPCSGRHGCPRCACGHRNKA